MTDFAGTWSAAKKQYEAATGKKKPAESDGKWYEKVKTKSGVAAELKAIDKLLPDNVMEPVSDKALTKVREHAASAKKAAEKYIDVVQKAVENEKALGKDKSNIYRDLKILRATLESIITQIETLVTKMKAAQDSVVDKVTAKQKVTYVAIKALGASMDSGAKSALLFAQGILKNPDPGAYNYGIQKAARDFTQPFANVKKWTIPDELNPTHSANRMIAMSDPAIHNAVRDLYAKVNFVKKEVLPIVNLTGSTPTDASLGKLAEGGVNLPLTATAADVTAAAKHLIKQIKEAMLVRGHLKV